MKKGSLFYIGLEGIYQKAKTFENYFGETHRILFPPFNNTAEI